MEWFLYQFFPIFLFSYIGRIIYIYIYIVFEAIDTFYNILYTFLVPANADRKYGKMMSRCCLGLVRKRKRGSLMKAAINPCPAWIIPWQTWPPAQDGVLQIYTSLARPFASPITPIIGLSIFSLPFSVLPYLPRHTTYTRTRKWIL